jgi:hypothetical protein
MCQLAEAGLNQMRSEEGEWHSLVIKLLQLQQPVKRIWTNLFTVYYYYYHYYYYYYY